MALRRLSAQILGPASHLPTWMLIVGTFAFWIELYWVRLPYGYTSWTAWILWGAVACIVMANTKPAGIPGLRPWQALLALLAFVYIGIVFYAALLPPHLCQEFDAINYHITVPRQHLLRHSFAHIPWSVADLFLLPLDYALSPYWLSTQVPNKFPQFIFFLCVLPLVWRIVKRFSGEGTVKPILAVAAVMAIHMNAIQAGTAMLDMVMLYCVLAAIDSFLCGRFAMAAVEASFFFWSKSFIPPMVMVIGVCLLFLGWLLLRKGLLLEAVYLDALKRKKTFLVFFSAVSVIIALPHVLHSLYYSGSVLFPFGVMKQHSWMHLDSQHWGWIVRRARDCVQVKDAYGQGRGLIAFIKHFWLIAVPQKGVNNIYDYPVGLIYLIFLAPFMLSVVGAFKSRKIPLVSIMVLLWWMVWWFGSQQTRFLMIPFSLMAIISVISLSKITRTLIVCIGLAFSLEVVSLVNAHRHDWGRAPFDVLREEDKDLCIMSGAIFSTSSVELDRPDVAYAAFPVDVRVKDSIYVIPQ